MAEVLEVYRPARDHTPTRRLTYVMFALAALQLVAGTVFALSERTWLGGAWIVFAALLLGSPVLALRTHFRVRSDGVDWRRVIREETLPWEVVSEVQVRSSTNPYEPGVEVTFTTTDGRRLQVPSDLVRGLAHGGSAARRATIVQALKRGAEARGVEFVADDALMEHAPSGPTPGGP